MPTTESRKLRALVPSQGILTSNLELPISSSATISALAYDLNTTWVPKPLSLTPVDKFLEPENLERANMQKS